MKQNLLLIIALLLFPIMSHGQDVLVRGTVVDNDGQPMMGVSVLVKGTTNGTVTNINGEYSLHAPANTTLRFQSIGYTPREENIGSRTVINVRLEPDAYDINTIVVTATGMTRQQKTLGYATATVNAEDIAAGKSASMMDGLTGKVPGLSISTAGGTGTSQKVIIRGYSSLTANQPLYVIDGLPLLNSFSGVGGNEGLNNAIDFGNQASDINPEEIESITVLKGASATALYGSRAGNGVIMITTKRGQKNQGIKVTYDASFMGTDVLRVAQQQQMFGQGWGYPYYYLYGIIPNYHTYLGSWASNENGSWGPRLDGRVREWNIGANMMGEGEQLLKPFSYVDNSIRHFYEIGFEMTNNISVSGGNENHSFMATYGNVHSNGVLPGNSDYFRRNTFSVHGNANIKNGLATLDYNISYSRKDIQNAMAGQGGMGATIYANIMQYPVDFDYADLKDGVQNNSDNFYTPYAKNPWWVVDHNRASYQDDRVYGNINLTIPLVRGLSAVGRLGGDFTNSREKYMNDIWAASPGSWNYGEANPEIGSYEEINSAWNQLEASALLAGDYRVGDFSINGTAGWNLSQYTSGQQYGSMQGLIMPGWFSFKNSDNIAPISSGTTRKRLIGLLFQGDVGFRDYAYLTLSLRNDWSSTLPIDNNSFFYWGLNGTVLLTEMFPDIKSDILNFLKIRMAYGKTGSDAMPYRTGVPYYITNDGTAGSRGITTGFGELVFPIKEVAGFTQNPLLPSNNLEPEISTEYEAGFDLRMLNNRLYIDASYYHKTTKNQIIALNVAPETGSRWQTANIGAIQNQGVEILIGAAPIRNKDFRWDVTYTFSKNMSEVLELWGDITERNIYGLGNTPQLVAMVGQPLGVFTYADYRRVENGEHAGKIIVNNLGFPEMSSSETQILGKSEPDFMMGLSNKFQYKDLTLSLTLDWRKGGIMYSNTKSINYFVGNAPETAYNERNSFILPNSVRLVNGEYVENNTPVDIAYGSMYYYWYSGFNSSMTINDMISKSYLKLRELTVSYTLPSAWFSNTKVISAVEVSLIGRNLLMWTSAGNTFIDPEITNFGNDLVSEWGEFYAAPSTRTFGGSIRVTF